MSNNLKKPWLKNTILALKTGQSIKPSRLQLVSAQKDADQIVVSDRFHTIKCSIAQRAMEIFHAKFPDSSLTDKRGGLIKAVVFAIQISPDFNELVGYIGEFELLGGVGSNVHGDPEPVMLDPQVRSVLKWLADGQPTKRAGADDSDDCFEDQYSLNIPPIPIEQQEILDSIQQFQKPEDAWSQEGQTQMSQYMDVQNTFNDDYIDYMGSCIASPPKPTPKSPAARDTDYQGESSAKSPLSSQRSTQVSDDQVEEVNSVQCVELTLSPILSPSSDGEDEEDTLPATQLPSFLDSIEDDTKLSKDDEDLSQQFSKMNDSSVDPETARYCHDERTDLMMNGQGSQLSSNSTSGGLEKAARSNYSKQSISGSSEQMISDSQATQVIENIQEMLDDEKDNDDDDSMLFTQAEMSICIQDSQQHDPANKENKDRSNDNVGTVDSQGPCDKSDECFTQEEFDGDFQTQQQFAPYIAKPALLSSKHIEIETEKGKKKGKQKGKNRSRSRKDLVQSEFQDVERDSYFQLAHHEQRGPSAALKEKHKSKDRKPVCPTKRSILDMFNKSDAPDSSWRSRRPKRAKTSRQGVDKKWNELTQDPILCTPASPGQIFLIENSPAPAKNRSSFSSSSSISSQSSISANNIHIGSENPITVKETADSNHGDQSLLTPTSDSSQSISQDREEDKYMGGSQSPDTARNHKSFFTKVETTPTLKHVQNYFKTYMATTGQTSGHYSRWKELIPAKWKNLGL